MNLPSLPTDNLWKFLALFLLAVTLGLGYASISTAVRRDNERMQRQMVYAKSWADIKHWQQDIEDLRANTSLPRAERAKRLLEAIDEKHRVQLRGDEERWQDSLWVIHDAVEGVNIKLWMDLSTQFFYATFMAFVLWWWQYQRHMDGLLRQRVEEGRGTARRSQWRSRLIAWWQSRRARPPAGG